MYVLSNILIFVSVDKSTAVVHCFQSEVNMILVSSHGQKFSCSAPDLQAMKSRLIKEEADGFDKFPNVSEILSVLAERDCLIKVRT